MTDQSYSIRQATDAMAVGKSTLDKWVRQYRQEKQGFTPDGSKSIHTRTKAKETYQAIGTWEDILKQASVLLGSGNLKKY